MARKRIKRGTQRKAQVSPRELLKTQKNKVILGFVVLVVIAFALFSKSDFKKQAPVSVTPTPSEKTEDAAIQAITNRVLTSPTPIVTKLPFTAGESLSYLVQKGDTLYKIGVQFCDDRAAWIDIAEQNKIVPPYILHTGDVLTVSCP